MAVYPAMIRWSPLATFRKFTKHLSTAIIRQYGVPPQNPIDNEKRFWESVVEQHSIAVVWTEEGTLPELQRMFAEAHATKIGGVEPLIVVPASQSLIKA